MSQGILDWTLMHALKASPKGTVDCVTAFGTTDFREDLKKFDVPTLILHGEADAIVPVAISASIFPTNSVGSAGLAWPRSAARGPAA